MPVDAACLGEILKMKTDVSTSRSQTQGSDADGAVCVVKKKQKKSRDKMSTGQRVTKTSSGDHLANKGDSSGSSEYTVGQIANLLSSRKAPSTSQQPEPQNDSKLQAVFGSMGSTGRPTCSTKMVFMSVAASKGPGERKRMVERMNRLENEARHPMQKESRKQQQQQQAQASTEQQVLGKDIRGSNTAKLETAKADGDPRKERPSRPSLDESNRTIFVGNLPMSFEKKKLRKLFRKFGDIKSMRFRSVAPSDPDLPKRVIAHTKQFHPERNSMNAYIVFQTEEAAQKALKRNGKLVENHHIRVDLTTNSRKHDTKHSVFLGNLPFDVSDDVVREHFEQCGTVENVRVIRDAKTGLGKGFGYLLFAENVSVEFALKLDGSRMAGRNIRVQRATKQKQIALNAIKRLNMKEVANTKRKGGKPGRVKPGRVKPGQVKPRQGKLRQTKSTQLRSKHKGHLKKGRAPSHAKKHVKLPKGKRK